MASISRRAEIRALASLASRLGQRVWIVGGAARDLQLDRAVPEVDAAVSGDAPSLAQAMESAGLGRAVPLSLDPPRVFRVAGKRAVDLAEIAGGSIEEDLKRRDFTVNAMAFDLATRQWLDPFGGLEDLAAGRLRAVSARNLAEDPLRVLRAARFLATHGLVPDPETARACRRVAPRLAGVAAERIRAEWIKVLEARRAAPALRWASRARLLRPALRVGEAAARSLARSAALFDAPALREEQPESRRQAAPRPDVRAAPAPAGRGSPLARRPALRASRGRRRRGPARARLPGAGRPPRPAASGPGSATPGPSPPRRSCSCACWTRAPGRGREPFPGGPRGPGGADPGSPAPTSSNGCESRPVPMSESCSPACKSRS